MKLAWVLGWAVPEDWFRPFAKALLPEARHVIVSASTAALAQLEAAGPFDWVIGYSLGSLLLLGEADRASRLGRVALLAPIFSFPREANLGGRVAGAQVRQLARWLRREPEAALADFYRRAGLEVPAAAAKVLELETLLWGLERLEKDRVAPPLPIGWLAWCGAEDALLDAARLQAIEPRVTLVNGATHHPQELIFELMKSISKTASAAS